MKWISAKIRFPEAGKNVLTACKNKNMEDGIWLYDLCYYYSDTGWEGRDNWEDVLYWTYIDKPEVKEPASEDLEQASEEYAYTNWESDDYHEGASEGKPFDAIGHTRKCFIDGAQWQKEQMMRDAVEATIVETQVGLTGGDLDLLISIPENLGLKDGDEVKVIINKV